MDEKHNGNGRRWMQASLEAQLLTKRLLSEKGNVGKIITYAELTDACGTDVQLYRAALYTARKNVQIHHRMVFDTVRGKGLILLLDNEILECGQKALERARRCARRGRNKIACADYSQLNADGKNQWNTLGTLLGLIDYVGRPKIQEQTTEKVARIGQEVSPAQLLDALK